MQTNVLSVTQLASEVLDTLHEFERKCGHIPGTPSSMLPSEILAFCAACRASGIEQVVESGRSYGYSTRCLAEMGFRVISYDIAPNHASDEKLKQYRNLQMETGPCPVVVTAKSPFGLLLDGPKGLKALSIVDQSNPTVVGIHDCCEHSVIRTHIEQRQWVTTDALNPCEELDRQHLAARGLTRDVLKEAFVLGMARFLKTL